MTVLELNMSDASWLDETLLRRRVQQSSALRITMEVTDLYQAASRTRLAQNWLKIWYISECLARHGNDCQCSFHEVEFGAGLVVLEFAVQDVPGLVATVIEFAPVFDPDDLEASAEIYGEAEEWLDKRTEPPMFGELEKCYRDDAEAAREDGYRVE